MIPVYLNRTQASWLLDTLQADPYHIKPQLQEILRRFADDEERRRELEARLRSSAYIDPAFQDEPDDERIARKVGRKAERRQKLVASAAELPEDKKQALINALRKALS
jgi:hypothetical protein